MAKIKPESLVDGEQPIVVLEDGTEIALSDIDGGYLRQSDYTTKTQALAAEKKALEEAKANQQLNSTVKSQPDANTDKLEMTKMYLSTKMETMHNKYGEDFNEVEVLKKAQNLLQAGVTPTDINFDDIHKAMAFSKQDPDSLKEQIRKELLEELQANNFDTSSIIGGNDGGVQAKETHGLSPQELAFCAKVGEDPKTYAKYKNRK